MTSDDKFENANRLDPAFPIHVPGEFYAHGLSKRELFAMAAMQGLLVGASDWSADEAAGAAVIMADALIAALKGEPK